MTKKEKIKWLSLLKVKYGNVIPLFTDVKDIRDNLEMYGAVAGLASKGFLYYGYELVIDDEGIAHPFERGYRFTSKAIELLEEASK